MGLHKSAGADTDHVKVVKVVISQGQIV